MLFFFFSSRTRYPALVWCMMQTRLISLTQIGLLRSRISIPLLPRQIRPAYHSYTGQTGRYSEIHSILISPK